MEPVPRSAEVVPAGANPILFRLAPALAALPAMMTIAVIPFAGEIVIAGTSYGPLSVADLDIGILYLLAIGSLGAPGYASAAMPDWKRDFRIIDESPPYPRALEMVRDDLDPRIRERLRQVLVEAGDDPDAREALLQFFGTTRFLPIDGDTSAVLDDLRRGVARVRAEAE